MRGVILALLVSPLVAASALAQSGTLPPDDALRQAIVEQKAADLETAKLEWAASRAKGEADKLHSEEAAAAEAIEAGEARISAANARLALVSADIAAYRQRLIIEQQPVSSLLAGLATMARRPPLLVFASRGSTDELVEVRLLLASTLPVIRRRTGILSAQLAQGERLRETAVAAQHELTQSRHALMVRRQHFAILEQKAVERALSSSGQALGSSDLAIAANEQVEQLQNEQVSSQSIRRVAAQLADESPAPASPFAAEALRSRAPFAYALPTIASVVEGLGSINDSGVRSRGLTLATTRGMPITAPAEGTVKFSGPFRDYDGILIIDHGGGWLSLIVNAGSPLHPGDHVALGQEIGRALGPVQVELSHNGRQISPALIAGSSQNLSIRRKGG